MCQNWIGLEKLVSVRNKILNAIEKEIMTICRSEKRRTVGSNSTLQKSCWYVGNISNLVGDLQQ